MSFSISFSQTNVQTEFRLSRIGHDFYRLLFRTSSSGCYNNISFLLIGVRSNACVRADSPNRPFQLCCLIHAVKLWCKETKQPQQVLNLSKLFELTNGNSMDTSLVWLLVSGKQRLKCEWKDWIPGCSVVKANQFARSFISFMNHHRKTSWSNFRSWPTSRPLKTQADREPAFGLKQRTISSFSLNPIGNIISQAELRVYI